MKRMDKVESIIGQILTKEDGRGFVFDEEDILSVYKVSKNRNNYVAYEINGGVWIYTRNTKACTYYEVLDNKSDDYEFVVEEVEEPTLTSFEEQACTIVDEIFEEIEVIDWNTVDFTELDKVDVVNFYYKGFNKHYVIENEISLCMGFGIEGSNEIYIPIEPLEVGEKCSIVNIGDVENYITENIYFLNDICKLGYSDKIYEPDNNEVRVWYKDAVLELNKKNCNKIVSQNGTKGFLVGNDYVFVEKINSSLIDFYVVWTRFEEEFESLIENNPDDYKMVYKKYISKKRTSGISDRVSSSMFEYLKY